MCYEKVLEENVATESQLDSWIVLGEGQPLCRPIFSPSYSAEDNSSDGTEAVPPINVPNACK